VDSLKNDFYNLNNINYKEMDLKTHIKEILQQRGRVRNENILDQILSDQNMIIYNKAFTHSSIDQDNNYENYELLGDSTSNKCIIFWFFRKYPILRDHPMGYKIMARIKILYFSKVIFKKISDLKLNFEPYIQIDPVIMEKMKYKILTDVFEAFIAATELIFDSTFQIGIGYSVVYNIIASIFDELKITLSYEALIDETTRLKELGENPIFKQQIGILKEVCNKFNDFEYECHIKNQKQIIIGSGTGKSQKAAKKAATRNALVNLKAQGIFKVPAEPWSLL